MTRKRTKAMHPADYFVRNLTRYSITSELWA